MTFQLNIDDFEPTEILGVVSTPFPNGLLIAASIDSEDTHDEWDPVREVVHAGPDSLYIGVRDFSSGLVTVVSALVEHPPSGLVTLFSGSLELSSPVLEVSEPGRSMVLQVPVPETLVNLTVYGDHPSESSLIVLGVDGEF